MKYMNKSIEELHELLKSGEVTSKERPIDSLLSKYKNCIRSISSKCKKKGIKLKINEPK